MECCFSLYQKFVTTDKVFFSNNEHLSTDVKYVRRGKWYRITSYSFITKLIFVFVSIYDGEECAKVREFPAWEEFSICKSVIGITFKYFATFPSPNFHVVEMGVSFWSIRTPKKVECCFSCCHQTLTLFFANSSKIKTARAKHAKVLFLIIKYANLDVLFVVVVVITFIVLWSCPASYSQLLSKSSEYSLKSAKFEIDIWVSLIFVNK